MVIYLLIHWFKQMLWVLKEPSHQDHSFEHPQHNIKHWLSNKKMFFYIE